MSARAAKAEREKRAHRAARLDADLNAAIDRLRSRRRAAGTRSPGRRPAERQDAPAAQRLGFPPGATLPASSRGSTAAPSCRRRPGWTNRQVFTSRARRDEEVVMRAILALLFLLGSVAAARAQCAPAFDWSGFYPPAALDRVAQRSAPGLRSNFEQVLLPRLTDRERQQLGRITLDLSRREYRRASAELLCRDRRQGRAATVVDQAGQRSLAGASPGTIASGCPNRRSSTMRPCWPFAGRRRMA